MARRVKSRNKYGQIRPQGWQTKDPMYSIRWLKRTQKFSGAITEIATDNFKDEQKAITFVVRLKILGDDYGKFIQGYRLTWNFDTNNWDRVVWKPSQ